MTTECPVGRWCESLLSAVKCGDMHTGFQAGQCRLPSLSLHEEAACGRGGWGWSPERALVVGAKIVVVWTRVKTTV